MKKDKKQVLIELHYLPSLAFWSEYLKADQVIIEQQENYQKGGYRNRCHLAGANGLLALSVPLQGGKNQQQPIREVGIDNNQLWQKQHWRSIQSAYGKTPFFEHYADDLQALFQQPYDLLFDWNKDLLLLLLELLGLPDVLSWTENYQAKPAEGIIDLRNKIRPGKEIPVGFSRPLYPQAFQEKNGFLPNLSILDLLFCVGPESPFFLENYPQG